MTAEAFLAFTLAVALLLILVVQRWAGRTAALRLGGVLAAWLGYVGVIGAAGLIGDSGRRPPGFVFVMVPLALFMVLGVARSQAAGRLARRLPLAMLIGFQTYRIGVELFLHRLWRDGLVPRDLTFSGANLDILIGLSAPLLAIAAATGRLSKRAAIAWNLAGLALLANVIVRSVLTAPGPMQMVLADHPNRMPGMLPYAFLPAFLAPLAVALHILSLRHLRDRAASATFSRARAEPPPADT